MNIEFGVTTIVRNGNNIEVIAKFPDNSVDSVVTDPPYELGFMGKSWDSSGIAYNVELWQECLRVLKPGGHLLAFGGSRTYHRMVCAIEDAGFQIRDQIMWVYGSGFPKSLNISKAIDKVAGVEGKVIGHTTSGKILRSNGQNERPYQQGQNRIEHAVTAPATLEAQQWEGWGTALKPAHEPIVMARKPLDGTVANNVLTHGTGSINIDGCRVGEGAKKWVTPRGGIWSTDSESTSELVDNPLGRFPANFIHDGSDEVTQLFPDTGKSTGGRIGKKSMGSVTNVPAGQFEAGDPGYGDSGSAARFFYCAKAGKAERNAGLDGMPEKRPDDRTTTGMGTFDEKGVAKQANHHPTVKPLALMRYLVRLVTPPNGIVLDPFAGSGSTLVAATLEGFSSIGIEITEEYIPIIEARIEWAKNNVNQQMELDL